MKVKKIISLSILLCLCLTMIAYANVPADFLGSLMYWYADDALEIHRMKAYPYLAESVYGNTTFTPSLITQYTDYASGEWTDNGMEMSVVEDFHDANVLIYAGTYEMMKLVYSELPDHVPGYTHNEQLINMKVLGHI